MPSVAVCVGVLNTSGSSATCSEWVAVDWPIGFSPLFPSITTDAATTLVTSVVFFWVTCFVLKFVIRFVSPKR